MLASRDEIFLNCAEYKNPAFVSLQMHCASTTNNYKLMIFRKIMAIHFEGRSADRYGLSGSRIAFLVWLIQNMDGIIDYDKQDFFMIFLSPSRKILGWYCLDYVRFLPI